MGKISQKSVILGSQHHSLQRNPRADLLQNGLVGVITQRKESQIQVVKVDMRIQEIDAL